MSEDAILTVLTPILDIKSKWCSESMVAKNSILEWSQIFFNSTHSLSESSLLFKISYNGSFTVSVALVTLSLRILYSKSCFLSATKSLAFKI